MSSQRISHATAAVESWLRARFGWGPQQATINHAPQLSTPHFDLFIVAQRAVRGAGEFAVMSDGEAVLASNRENLARVLASEGYPADPASLPASQVARLYLIMAEARQARLIEHSGDPALGRLSPTARASFQPPHAEKAGAGAVVAFWSASLGPEKIERWRVQIAPDGGLSHSVELADTE
jgi:hypothetical protein